MQKEIEKKYELTNHDYEIIKDKCSFVKDEELKDYYLDTADFILGKNDYFLRLRNGKYELKILKVV
ncbi:MAG: CYTH domain-containing protein [Patescibacteria group bacterium]